MHLYICGLGPEVVARNWFLTAAILKFNGSHFEIQNGGQVINFNLISNCEAKKEIAVYF